MTTEEFWYGDKQLFSAYQKAYYRRLYEASWLQGLYVNLALSNLANNILSKKGTKPLQYPETPVDPFEKKRKPLNKQERETKFRSMMADINSWIEEGIKQ